jgi:hypothetical protein
MTCSTAFRISGERVEESVFLIFVCWRWKGRGNPRWMTSSARILGFSRIRNHYSRFCWTLQKETCEPAGNVGKELMIWTEKRMAQPGANTKIAYTCQVLVSISSRDVFSVSSAVPSICSVCACVFLCGVAPWLLGGRSTSADTTAASRTSINRAVSRTHSYP